MHVTYGKDLVVQNGENRGNRCSSTPTVTFQEEAETKLQFQSFKLFSCQVCMEMFKSKHQLPYFSPVLNGRRFNCSLWQRTGWLVDLACVENFCSVRCLVKQTSSLWLGHITYLICASLAWSLVKTFCHFYPHLQTHIFCFSAGCGDFKLSLEQNVKIEA